MDLICYTDGGCHGNPGPGGWAYVLSFNGGLAEGYGFDPETTNNRMELTAVIEALREIEKRFGPETSARVFTDSQYVRNGITSWIYNWKKNGWKTSTKKPVKNRELWIALDEKRDKLDVTWHWVEGHTGVELNERCDELVQQAIREASSS
ncbi:MAG: ribonuclease HI [Alkalispirochaetaceae bacterium]